MDFEQLQAFLAVAQTKSFTRSAEILHVAQSTITARIKLLEQHLGKPLFIRDSRRVELSSAGNALLPFAQRITELSKEGELAARKEDAFEERVVIGSLNSLWDYILFPVVRQFRSIHSNYSLRLVTGHSNDIVRWMMDGWVDVGIVYIPPQHPEIEVIPLYEDSIQLVGHPSIPIRDAQITAETLLQHPYLHLDWGQPFSGWYERQVGKHRLPEFWVGETTLYVKFLLAGDGIGFLLNSVSQSLIEQGQLQPIPFYSNTEIPKRTAYLIYPKRKQAKEGVAAWNDFVLNVWENGMRS